MSFVEGLSPPALAAESGIASSSGTSDEHIVYPGEWFAGVPPIYSGFRLPLMRPEFQDRQFLADFRQLFENFILIF